jgi:CDP-diacylglycerol--serine O-phosphatidyltransferase
VRKRKERASGAVSVPGEVRVLHGGAERKLPLHKGVYILPNLFTTAGLFLGVYSTILSSHDRFLQAAVCIIVAHLCDGIDGRLARLTNTQSHFGVEYDSLADLVAFGVAPGIMMYRWALEPWGNWGWLAASLYVACGALRLARFNVQIGSVEKHKFVGLPIPAAADMIASTVLLYYFFGGEGATHKHIVVLMMVYVLALLMVSNVRYHSFKDIDLKKRQPFYALVVIIVIIKFVVAEPQLLLFCAMLAYVASGPTGWLLSAARRRRRRAARLFKLAAEGRLRAGGE